MTVLLLFLFFQQKKVDILFLHKHIFCGYFFEALQMNTYNICFLGEIRKNIPMDIPRNKRIKDPIIGTVCINEQKNLLSNLSNFFSKAVYK